MEPKVHTTETATQESREWMEALKSNIGFVPNLAAVMSESPAWIRAFVNARRAFEDSGFTAGEREAMLLAAAVDAGNAYGVAVHSTVAAGNGVPGDDVDALRRGGEPRAGRLPILVRLIRSAMRDGRLTSADVEAAREAGLTPRCIMDVTVGATVARMVAWAHHLAPETPLDPPFAPQAWTAATANR